MIPEKLIEAVKRRRREYGAELPQKIRRRKEAALKEAFRLVEEFRKEDPALKKVVLFGSLAKDDVRDINFDIDLAFQGKEYYRCVAIALDSCFKVDVVDYDSAADFIREEIDTGGKVLYDSDN
jgi:predicted nucleotidyltransferase